MAAILQCGVGGAEPHAVCDLVFVGRPRVRPVRPGPVRFGQLCKGRVGELDHPLLQMLQALLAQSRRQSPDETVVLPMGVLGQRFEGPVGQLVRIGPGGAGDVAEVGGGAKDVDDRAGIVLAAVQGRVRHPHEPPHQVERLDGILRGDTPDDGVSEDLQVVHEIPGLPPVEDCARPADGGKPMPHLAGELGRAFRAGKLKSKQPSGGALARADLDQQLGEALCPESLQVPGVESFLGCHIAAGRHCCLDAHDLDPSFKVAQ